ncbi:LamG domain-containing protein [Candidatus Poribacteria bacterium]|nr:LamG domain-containing protein [Candidatus Poribacteria bacterium]
MNTRLMILIFALCVCIGHSNAANITDGLVGYWPLDGDGTDPIGKNDAKAEKGAKFVNDGWRNGAIELDGAGGHVKVSDKFKLTTSTVTVVAWINGWKTIDWSGIVVGRGGTPFWMGVAANDTLTYVWNNDAGNTWGWQGAPKIPKEKWAMVSIAIEPKKAMSYIYDGAAGKLDAAANEIPHLEQTITNLKFGWDECCGARYFKGKIDEVMIFNRTLTQAEIQQLAKQGLAVDSVGKLAVTWATIKQQ